MDRKYEKNISNTMNRVEFKPTTIACWAKTLPLSYQSDDITLKGLSNIRSALLHSTGFELTTSRLPDHANGLGLIS